MESIETFSIEMKGDQPTLHWQGCVPFPNHESANAVAAFSDGTIIATVTHLPGKTEADAIRGEKTGAVFEWRPGDATLHEVPGTELRGNNGLEISLDEKKFYVVGFGDETVFVYERKDPSKPLRQTTAPGFMPDNLRWSGTRLISAGTMYDEPACGGTRLAALNDPPGTPPCYRGYMVAELNPNSLAWKILAYGEPIQGVGSLATGVILDDTLWMGAAHAPGVLYRKLPGR